MICIMYLYYVSMCNNLKYAITQQIRENIHALNVLKMCGK